MTAVAIAETLGMDDSSLTYYPSVRMFFQQYESSNSRHLQKERLIAKAKIAIQQLEADGSPFSLVTLCRMIGCSRSGLKNYPGVEDLVKQSIENNHALRLQLKQQKAEEEEVRIKVAIQQLAAKGQPITLRTICKIIGKSPKTLYYHPNVVAFIKNEIKEKSREYRIGLRQRREDTLVERVLEARKQLQILQTPFSGRALAKQAGVSHDTLLRYRRVREILQQFRQECSQIKQS